MLSTVRVFSIVEDVQYLGGCSVANCGDTISTFEVVLLGGIIPSVKDIQYCGGKLSG